MKKKHLTGRCLCGGVQFVASELYSGIEACHCSQCARWTGSFFASVTVKELNMTFVSDNSLAWYESSDTGRRGFCSTCGSSLFWKRVGSEEIDILIGSFDQPTGLKISEHIFVADKSDFYDIFDDAPQYPGSRTNK